MTAADPPGLDRAALRRAFGAAARTYDESSRLQQHVQAELLARLEFFPLAPRVVLDLGAGTGRAALQLQRRYPRARVLALDIAPAMLAAVPQPIWRRRVVRLCADAHALPLAARSVDLVYSNLMMQWSDSLPALCAEISRVLRPGGLLVFSTFGPDTLRELRAAWAEADSGQHVSAFPDLPDLGDALLHAGLVEPVMDVEHELRHYADTHALMRELQRTGARNALRARARGLTGRARMQAMIRGYEQQRTGRGLPATFEIFFGAAFGGERGGLPEDRGSRATAEAAGEFAVPVSRIRRRS